MNTKKLMTWFTLIDILFLTYLPFIALSASVIIIIPWFLLNVQIIRRDKESTTWSLFFILAVISIGIGCFLYPENIYNYVKSGFIFLSSTIYYFYFKENLFYLEKEKVLKMLYMFVIFGTILAILYLVQPQAFSLIKRIVNPYDGVTNSFLNGDILDQIRYNFLWTDANNVAYMFSAITLFLLATNIYNFSKSCFLILCNVIILVATMSTGGSGSFVIGLLLLILFHLKNFRYVKKSDFVCFIIVVLFIVILGNTVLTKVINNNILIDSSLDRVSTNSLDSRISRWEYILNNKNIMLYFLFGNGPSIVVNNTIKAPHSGVLYLIYGYGGIAFLAFIKMFFSKTSNVKIKDYIFIVPIIIGFMINTLITNPKIMAIISLLVVMARYYHNSESVVDEDV